MKAIRQYLSNHKLIILTILTILIWAMIFNMSYHYYVEVIPTALPERTFKVGFYFMASIILACLMVGVLLDCRQHDLGQDLYICMVLLSLYDLLSYITYEYHLFGYFWAFLLNMLDLFVTPGICLAFYYYLKILCLGPDYPETLTDRIVKILGITDFLFVLIASFMGKLFYLDSSMNYIKGDWNAGNYIFPIILFTLCILLNFHYQMEWKKHVACLIFCICPLIMAIATLITKNTIFTHCANLTGCITIYGGVQAFRKYDIIEQKEELQKTRINAAILQINPHFIQNCLSSIRGLMYINASQAEEMLLNLSGYLRNTFSSLNETELIPVEKEMELVEMYLSIEQARFPGMIQVEKRIECPDFRIPAFTIEPLVENAIRHGIREKDDAGTVKILVLDQISYVEIIIQDDGIGFDLEKVKNDGRKHIGINNVKSRIHLMTKGTFTIFSQQGIGTTARIILPKGEKSR